MKQLPCKLQFRFQLNATHNQQSTYRVLFSTLLRRDLLIFFLFLCNITTMASAKRTVTRELQEFSLQDAVVHIIEASIKLECSFLTKSKALLLYHQFKTWVEVETHYDPYIVAAACLSLSIVYNDERIEFDAVVLAFLSMIKQGSCLSTQSEEFKAKKKSVMSMKDCISRYSEFSSDLKLAHQFLPYFMYSFREEMSLFNTWVFFVDTCMKIASDFYFTNKCLEFKPEEIASTVIQVTLYLTGIKVTDESHLKPKIQALCNCDDETRRKIIENIFKVCDIAPVVQASKMSSQK